MSVDFDRNDPWDWPLCSNQRWWSEVQQKHTQCPIYTRHESGLCAGCRRDARIAAEQAESHQ